MSLRAVLFGLAAPLLVSVAVPCVAQSTFPLASAMPTISVTIMDADSGQTLSAAPVQVQLFPPEHGARKPLSRLCVPMDIAQPTFTSRVTTDPNGSISLTVPGGDHLVRIAMPQRQPVHGCIHIDTEESLRRCGARPTERQQFFVRSAASIPGYSGDIVGSSACAPHRPSPCDPIGVPNLVKAKTFVLLDSEGSPIGSARLEFREYTKGKARLIAKLMTDATGMADVSSLLDTGGLLRMSIDSDRASGDFLVQFAKGATPGQQTMRLFRWRCQGNVMRGVILRP